MTLYLQGDPRLFLDEEGSRLVFRGGQPVMDRGIENAVLISLFTKRGWCGNVFFRDPNQQVGSDFQAATAQPITLSALNDIRDAAEKALQWMVGSGIASNITATVTNPRSNWLDIAILVQPPGQDINILLLQKHGLNWIFQKIDPAYLRE